MTRSILGFWLSDTLRDRRFRRRSDVTLLHRPKVTLSVQKLHSERSLLSCLSSTGSCNRNIQQKRKGNDSLWVFAASLK